MTAKGFQYLEAHPVASIFPPMEPDEYKALVEDIANHGVREPITLVEGKIADGWHRYRACRELEIDDPPTREWDGAGSLVEFVVSLNLKRRQLTSSQAAAVATEILPLLEAEARERMSEGGKGTQEIADLGESREKAATLVGSNRQYVSEAKKLQREAPDLLEKVRSGDATLGDANRTLQVRKINEAYPFTAGWAEYRVLEASELLDALPENERPRAVALVDQPATPSEEAVKMLRYLREHSPQQRQEIYQLNESDDPRDRSLAITTAASMPPMPDPRLHLLRDARRCVRSAQKLSEGDVLSTLGSIDKSITATIEQVSNGD